MNKKQLLADLSAKTFVNKLLADEVLQVDNMPGNMRWYRISFFEVLGKAAISRTIDFYTIDEGKETEAAYYKDSEPVAQIQIKETI